MAKLIKLSDETIAEMTKEFNEQLKKAKISDGKITYTKSFASVPQKADITFTESAWLKMMALVDQFNTEIAWHGVAKRGDDPEKNEYIISDILVYPQYVSGAYVDTDDEECGKWRNALPDDVMCNLRMQGHSHVNMSTSPSSTDLKLYSEILDMVSDNGFYIFMIWNKKREKMCKVYDMQKNILFDTSDCTITVRDDGIGIEQIVNDAKAKVRTKTYTTGATGTTPPAYLGGYGGGYGNYQGTGYASYTPTSVSGATSVAPVATAAGNTQPAPKEEEPKKQDKRKAHRPEKKSKVAYSSTNGYKYYDDIDFEDTDYFDTSLYDRWGV